jgi:hypothetical protein
MTTLVNNAPHDITMRGFYTVQVSMTDDSGVTNSALLELSLDGVNFQPIPNASWTADDTENFRLPGGSKIRAQLNGDASMNIGYAG